MPRDTFEGDVFFRIGEPLFAPNQDGVMTLNPQFRHTADDINQEIAANRKEFREQLEGQTLESAPIIKELLALPFEEPEEEEYMTKSEVLDLLEEIFMETISPNEPSMFEMKIILRQIRLRQKDLAVGHNQEGR